MSGDGQGAVDDFPDLSPEDQAEFDKGFGGDDGEADVNSDGDAPPGKDDGAGGDSDPGDAEGDGGERAGAEEQGEQDEYGDSDEDDQPPSDEPPSSDGDQQGGDAPATDAQADETGPSNQDGSTSEEQAEGEDATSLSKQIDQMRQEFKTTLGRIQSTQQKQLEEAYERGRRESAGEAAGNGSGANGNDLGLPDELLKEINEGREMGDGTSDLIGQVVEHFNARLASMEQASRDGAIQNEDDILLGMLDAQLGGSDWRDITAIADEDSERTFDNEDFDKFMQSNYTHKQIHEVLNTRDPSKIAEAVLSYRAASKKPDPPNGASGQQGAGNAQQNKARNARRDSSSRVRTGGSDPTTPKPTGRGDTFNDGWNESLQNERARLRRERGEDRA